MVDFPRQLGYTVSIRRVLMSLGTTISRLRAEKKLSQGDLADALGVSRQSVSK